jgi:hypothetical protein
VSTYSLKQRIDKLEGATTGTLYLSREDAMAELRALDARMGGIDLDATWGSPALQEARRKLKELTEELAATYGTKD